MNRKGFTFIEVLISIIVFSVISVIMANAFMQGNRTSIKNYKKRAALGLAQEAIEFVKSRPFGEKIDLPAESSGFKRQVKTRYVTKDNFNRISPVETDFINIEVTVSEPDIPDIMLSTVINRDISRRK